MSNALGTLNPVGEIVARATPGRRRRADRRIAGRRATLAVDVQALGADFYVFTGHKLYGPTGIGVLYGREAVLDAMPPFLGGGDMIRTRHLRGQHVERSAVQVRGRHAEHRRRRRPGRGHRLRARDRLRRRSERTKRRCSTTRRGRSTAIEGLQFIGTARRKAERACRS